MSMSYIMISENGLFALISTGVSGINETIMILKDNNIPVKIAVGVADMTQEESKRIGADVYGKDAWEDLRMIRQLMKGKDRDET